MRPETLIAGRYRVRTAAAGPARVGRVRVVDEQTGEPFDALFVRPAGAAPAVLAAFERQHRQLARVDAPDVVRTHAIVEHEGAPVVLRQPLEDSTLADLGSTVPTEVLAAVGAALVPAIVAAGPGSGGTLTAVDIGIDARGRPVLAPFAQPADRVTPERTAHAPPEAFTGAPVDSAGALYGLGVLLYRLATGRLPEPIGPDRVIAPPSSFRFDLGRVDAPIRTLMDPDPMVRAGALPLFAQAAGPMPDLRTLALPSEATAGEIRTTRAADPSPSALVDVRRASAATVVPAAHLAALDGRQRSRLAGALQISVRTLDRHVAEGRDLVLSTHASARLAHGAASDRSAELGVPVHVSAAPSVLPPLAGAALFGATGIVGGIALFMGLLPLLALPAVSGVIASGLSWRWWRRRQHLQSHLNADPLPQPAAALRRPWARLAAARVQLADANIPEAAAGDLRSALTEVERHLEELGRIDQTIVTTLRGVDAAELAQRLRRLTVEAERQPRHAAERDRIARSLDDLAALQRRHEQLLADIARVDSAIDGLIATLGGLVADDLPDADGLAQLERTTQLTRQALRAEATQPPPPVRGEPT